MSLIDSFKLVFSDLHIGEGRYLRDGRINAEEDFFDDELFADLLWYYSKDKYSTIPAEIVFNGDIFNLIQSATGGRYDGIITEDMVAEAMENTVNGHRQFFDAVNRFFSGRKEAKISYIIGNHDQPVLSERVQNIIRKSFDADVTFYPTHYRFGNIHCEHGHRAEYIHRYNPYKVWKDYDDVRVLIMPWGNHFVVQFLTPLKKRQPYIDKIRPLKIYLKWSLLFDTISAMKFIFNMVKFYIRNRFGHPDPEHRKIFAITKEQIADAAMHLGIVGFAERFIKMGYKIVILGHTHIPLRKRIFDGEYFNTGTWIRMSNIDLGQLGRKWQKTYITIEYQDEKVKPSLKVWHGLRRYKEEVGWIF